MLVNWQRLARANTHPLRISILEVLELDRGRTLSPKDLSVELQTALSTVNYHVTELLDSGLLELVDERKVRGATEHFYRPVDDPQGSNGRAGAHNGHARNGNGHARQAGKKKRTTGLEPATSSLGSSRSTS
jgi:DNA-binding transcriptional ArsR family regulator